MTQDTNTDTLLGDIDASIKQLQAQRAALLAASRDAALAEVLDAVRIYSFTARELGLIKLRTDPRASPKVKYKDENGNTWTGRGGVPRWIVKSGKPKEAFLVN